MNIGNLSIESYQDWSSCFTREKVYVNKPFTVIRITHNRCVYNDGSISEIALGLLGFNISFLLIKKKQPAESDVPND